MSHSTGTRRQAPDEVVAWLQRYEPRSVPIDLWLGQLRDFVVPAVLRVAPVALSSARSTVHALTHLAVWCLAQGMPLTWDVVLDPDTVERYICVGIPNWRSRGTYRALLRRLGPLLTTKAPWEPRPEAVNRRHFAAPYSPTTWSCSGGTPSTREHRPGSGLRRHSSLSEPAQDSMGVGAHGWQLRTSSGRTASSSSGLASRWLVRCPCWPGGKASSATWLPQPGMSSLLGGIPLPRTGPRTWP